MGSFGIFWHFLANFHAKNFKPEILTAQENEYLDSLPKQYPDADKQSLISV